MRRGATSDVLLSASGLQPGSTARLDCPACNGGQYAERSTLSVTVSQDGTVLWKCHRASCGFAGRQSAGGAEVRESGPPQRKATRRLLYPPRTMTEDEEAYLLHRVEGLSQEWLDYLKHERSYEVGFVDEFSGYAFPILDELGRRRGYVVRRYNGVEPKALTFYDDSLHQSHACFIDARLGRENAYLSNSVVVVEDIPSMLAVSPYVDSVALLGTNARQDQMGAIARLKRRVIWALDADATKNAIELHMAMGTLFHESRVMILDRDLKDTPPQGIQQLLRDFADDVQ